MNAEPLADYQLKSCPLCVANVPHAKHITALDAAKLGVTIVTVSLPSSSTPTP